VKPHVGVVNWSKVLHLPVAPGHSSWAYLVTAEENWNHPLCLSSSTLLPLTTHKLRAGKCPIA
jgi:hypothetical protein